MRKGVLFLVFALGAAFSQGAAILTGPYLQNAGTHGRPGVLGEDFVGVRFSAAEGRTRTVRLLADNTVEETK